MNKNSAGEGCAARRRFRERAGGQRRAVGAATRHGEAAVPRETAVTRAELISELAASSPHLLVEDAELIVATVFDQITAALARGERVELRGFGAFKVKQRNARFGRNPRTGETVQVDEKAAPFFKAGKEMLRRLNRDGMKLSHAATTAPAPADEAGTSADPT